MKHGSLFSGIGGFDLAAEWMGWENIFHCEWNPFCQKILKQHFPKSIAYGDITKTDFTVHRGRVDILTGGFPCQPFSTAGKKKGTEDNRYLWPEMLRAVREIQPRFILGENVPGLINKFPLVFEQIQVDLENEGYEIWPVILPACGQNAPHKRHRIWFVAHRDSVRFRRIEIETQGCEQGKNGQTFCKSDPCSVQRNDTDIDSQGLQKRIRSRIGSDSQENATFKRSEYSRTFTTQSDWEKFPTQSPVCGGDDGIPFELDFIKRIEDEKNNSKKILSEASKIIWSTMRFMWHHRKLAETSPDIYAGKFCDFMPEMPLEGTHERWNMGAWIKEDKELHYMWECFYSKSFNEAQDLQQKLFERIGQIECSKKMENKQRVDRIKALGNAVVPQVVFQIFKAIEATEYFNPTPSRRWEVNGR